MQFLGDKHKRELVAKIFRKKLFNQGLDFFLFQSVLSSPDWDSESSCLNYSCSKTECGLPKQKYPSK